MADGGSNAIGSIQEYDVVSHSEGRQTSVEFNICYCHQNEHSGGYASGTMKFADKPNEELGAILRKSHEIQVWISQAPKCMKLYFDINGGKVISHCLLLTLLGRLIGMDALMRQ